MIIKRITTILVVISIIMLSFTHLSAQNIITEEEEISAEEMVFDALIVRPVSLVGIVFGSVVFVVSLPFSAIGKNVDESYDKLIRDPVDYTFNRPLGAF